MLRSLGGKSRFRSSPRRPIRRERLAVEALEARDVPAAFTWVQTDPGTFNWSNGGNWTGGPAGAFPNDPADIASITSVLNGDETINIQGAIAVDSAVVGATGGGGTFTLHFDLNGTTPGSGYSQLTAADTVTLTAAALGLSVGVGFTVPDATSFTLIDAANPIVGTFAGLPEGATFAAGGETFRITYQGGADGNDVVLTSETPPAFTSAPAATFYTGMLNSFPVTASGIPAPTFDVAAGSTLPDGVSLGSLGLLIGVSSMTPGTYTFDVVASNGVGTPATQPFTLTVEAGAAPGITSANNATFVTGTGGTFSVAATGNPAPTFGVSAGTLPTGTTLNAATGVLTVGPATAAGAYSFTLAATNPLGTSTQPFTLTVAAAPQITSPAAATFFTGMNNAFQLIATGLPTPTFGVTSGSLPSGVNLSSDGVLAGVPSATGSFPVTITATNGVNPDAVQNFALTVTAGTPPGITNPNNVSVVAGVGGTFAFTAAGAPSPTFAVVSGALPTGASLGAATGVLTVGTNTPAGTYDFSVRATNPLGTSTQPFRLTVGTPPAITSANAVTFYTGTFNTFTMTATGSPDVTFSETGPLPAGVGLLTNGILSGQPIAAGVYPITVTAANGVGSPATRPFTLTVETGIVPGFISAGVASFTPGVGGTFQVAATGNPTPVLAQTASLPTGVTFTPATGVLAVAPTTAAGRYTLTFTATSVIGQATQTFTLDVTTVPAFTSANVVSLAAGTGGTFQITASGAPTPTITQTATLPSGVRFDAATGLLTVAPTTAAGTYNLSFTAANVAGTTTTGFVLRVIAPSLTLLPTGLPGGRVGLAYGQQLTATGGTAPFTFSVIAGGLPPGLTLAANGLVSGTPTLAGTYGFTAQANNSTTGAPLVGTRAYSIVVAQAGAAAAPPPARLSVGGAAGSGAVVYDPAGGTYPTTPTAAVNPFAGLGVNVRTAVGDVNNDGFDDTVLVTGPGTAVRFAVVSGADNTTLLVAPTAPFTGSESFTGGGFVSAGDLDGDGRAEVVVSPDQGGGPRVTIFSLLPAGLTRRANFIGITGDDNFRGGARTAVGDVNGDGKNDVAVAAGFLGGPRVALFDGNSVLTTQTKLVNDFFAFPGTDAVTLRNGAYVAIGDVNGDSFGDLIFGGGPGGAPRVFVLSGQLVSAGNVQGAYNAPIANFFVAGNTTDRGGVRVAAVDADGDAKIDVAVGSGANKAAGVRVYLGKDFTTPNEPASPQVLAVLGGVVLTDGVYVG